MDRETLRKLAATKSAPAPQQELATPIAPPTINVTNQQKSGALRGNECMDVPPKKSATIDHAFKEQSPDIHKTDVGHWPEQSKSGAEKLKGGLADGKKPKDFCPKALDKGMKVEREHSSETSVQKEVAMDHLTEDPEYYEKLEKMEKGAAGNVRLPIPGYRQAPTAARAGAQTAQQQFGLAGGMSQVPAAKPGQDVAAASAGMKGRVFDLDPGADAPLELGTTAFSQQQGKPMPKMHGPSVRQPWDRPGRINTASYYELGVKEALEKFALAPLVAGGLALGKMVLPHIAATVAPMAAQGLVNKFTLGQQPQQQPGMPPARP